MLARVFSVIDTGLMARTGAVRVVVAAWVGSPDAVRRLTDADDVASVLEPPDFSALGA